MAKILILGVAGTMTAPLAVELQRLGHHVSGSDQDKIYPPFSNLLRRHHIPINQTPVSSDIDLVIVGSSFHSFTRTKDQFQQIITQKIPYISATDYLSQLFHRQNVILVAGSFGKTTIAALLAHTLRQAGLNPSFFFGGRSLNRLPSLYTTTSDWAIVEADESIHGLDTQAKFLSYPVTHLVVTSANWEHRDSYPTYDQNLQAFRSLISRLPPHGHLVYNPYNSPLCQIVPSTAIPYQTGLNFDSPLIGNHNQENFAAVYTLGRKLGLSDRLLRRSIRSFRGIARRLEHLSNANGIDFYDDFAQSPERISSAISAISHTFPTRPIKIFFEAHASFIRQPSLVSELKNIFTSTKEVILGPLNFSTGHSVTADSFRLAVGSKLIYLPLSKNIYNHYITTLCPNDILLHFSSGGLSGLQTLKKIIHFFHQPA